MNGVPERAAAPLSDLFASAVHRFGAVWADLLVASAIAVGLATVPVLAVSSGGASRGATLVIACLSYAIGYFVFLAFVMLRGLPERAPRRRVVWTYLTGVFTGILTGLLLVVLLPFVVVVVPLFLFVVPGVAAGDAAPIRTLVHSFSLALRNFSRVWGVWLITMLFSAPVMVSMFLAVNAFASARPAILLALVLSVPVVWPFSALFVRTLYGDLTGRLVVAAQDRTR